MTTQCATPSAGARGAASDEPLFDTLIVGARIVDGSGAPWFFGDVGIRGDTVAAVGDLRHAKATERVDAKGLVLAPGFVDLLGQSQSAVLKDPHLESKIRQGVTTEITGEGMSPGPINDAMAADRTAEAPDRAPPAWRSLGEYIKRLEAGGSAVNFAFFVGASNPRAMVLGNVNRDPTEEELQRMEAIVDQAMREGALGLSTSLIYLPAIFSKTEEIIRLGKVAARYGGTYFTHIRNENDQILTALDEAFRIGRESGMPVNIWHLKIGGKHNWGRMPEVIAHLQAERDKGFDVAANIYPYIASGTGLSALAPDWALEGGYKAFVERLKDPAQRAKIAEAIRTSNFYARLGGASGVLLARIVNPAHAAFEKKRLDVVAQQMGTDAVEAALRLFETNPRSPDALFFSMNEDDMKHALKQSWVSVGADSGAVSLDERSKGAHPRAYGTFPRILGRYAREEKLFTLEEAVRKITSQAAARVNIWDRGLVRPGMKADLVLFDPATVRDLSTYEEPHQFSEGIRDVFVNGVAVLKAGAMTSALPGRVLKGQGFTLAARP